MIVNKGAWSESVAYFKLDMVCTADSAYVSKVDNNLNHDVTDTDYWICIANGKPATIAAAASEVQRIADHQQYESDHERAEADHEDFENFTSGTYENLVAGDLVSLNDRVTTRDKFVIRTTAGKESIDSSNDALLLQLLGGHGFKINALRWNCTNAIDPAAWASGKTSGYITGTVANGAIAAGNHKLCIIRTPMCRAGEYGTAAENNGWLLTDNGKANRKVGDGVVVGVWHSPTLPALGAQVTAVTEHTFTGHSERFYLPDEGYMIVEVASGVNLANLCAHLAWSKDYDKFTAYASPKELVVAVAPLSTAFQTETVNGKTCLVLRGIEQGNGGIFDDVTIYPEGGGTYERNIATQLLSSLAWTETPIEQSGIDQESAVTGYRYTASLPQSGTYAAILDGLIRSDIEGMTLSGYTLTLDSAERLTPATAFAGKYVDYQMATPVSGTHSINPAGKLPDDMGTEEVVGGDSATGTIVISYMQGFKDTMRALVNEFRAASSEIEEMGYTKPNYCVGEWVENANMASPNDLDNLDALAVFGNREWALDWRPFLVDMTPVEGETRKRPVMELRKNNLLRDIYGNWAPVVGITEAMRNECMANALYTDASCTTQYCAAGAYDPETFLSLCSVQTVNGVKKLVRPKLYKAANTEVGHYLMPWETIETKYSIFVGRKDEVCLIDNVVGASGKEWNGIIAENVNFWDGVNVRVFSLPPTGICPSPMTAIKENDVVKLRSFYFDYAETIAKGYKGTATNCEMFYGDGHYPLAGLSQITNKNYARNNNHDVTKPFPVAEGGYHARNAFLRCIEAAWGTKYLCATSRFSSGVSSNDGVSNESQWLGRGGIRWKKTGDAAWNYCTWASNTHGIYKNAEGGRDYMVTTLNYYSFHCKPLEAQLAVSFAVEFGIGAGETFEFYGHAWRYENVTRSGLFSPATVAEGQMNCRAYKIVEGTFDAFNADGTPQSFDVEVCLRTGLMLGCDLSGDGAPYWGGGIEMVGECTVAPATSRYGHKIEAFIEPDQTKWVNENTVSVNIGQRFGFESQYKRAGSIVTRANNYIRRKLPNTPLPVSHCSSLGKGESGFGYMANYWGTVGKKTRVGLLCGDSAGNGSLSARCLFAYASAAFTGSYIGGSAQVLLDV